MNKKADVPIPVTILVIVTLAITSIALYSFLMEAGKVTGDLSGVGLLEKAIVKELTLKFYIQQAGEKALVKTYKEVIGDGGGYIKQVPIKSEKYYKFDEVRNDMNSLFKQKFYDNFKQEFATIQFGDIYLEDFRKNLLFNKLINPNSIFYAEEGLEMVFEGIEIKEDSPEGRVISVVYSLK